MKELGGKPEITRFKGLGEISPKEFQQFIGKEMRTSKVEYAPRAESGPIFNFYMGKNTPERKDYIMDSPRGAGGGVKRIHRLRCCVFKRIFSP
ncbi:MAG: hypothetical protein WDN00_06195 [Limisphaerales bacterium]